MPMPTCRARAWPRMPPVISGWEAAHAVAAAWVAKKFMYPQHTDADGLAAGPADVHHRCGRIPGAGGPVNVHGDRVARGRIGRFDHHRNAGHRGHAQGVDRAHGEHGRGA
jgi:hypothetical protein